MKNLSLILSIISLLAVLVLAFLQVKPANTEDTSSAGGPGIIGDLRVAFINSDSVLKHYEFLKSRGEILEAKKQKVEQDYMNRAQSLQNEIAAYQRNMNNMTVGQVRAVEEDLTKKRQNLQLYEESATQELMNDQAKLNKDLYDRITAYLKKYGKEKGLHVVFKFDPTSDILYGEAALDITNDIISGLNEEYKAEQFNRFVTAANYRAASGCLHAGYRFLHGGVYCHLPGNSGFPVP
ncbi:MAG: OmpH family outer membrane protein [Cyclobacteriaceae bacterium]|nr:OmpH family outer membrane protein [Cyclobacteriaceae bacterium]